MKCLRCGHEWEARVPNPARCPKCISPFWNKPRVRRVPRISPQAPRDEELPGLEVEIVRAPKGKIAEVFLKAAQNPNRPAHSAGCKCLICNPKGKK